MCGVGNRKLERKNFGKNCRRASWHENEREKKWISFLTEWGKGGLKEVCWGKERGGGGANF